MSVRPGNNRRFSAGERVKSVGYALSGIQSIFKTEHNMWIHLAATAGVTVLAFLLRVTGIEAVALVFAIGLVWVTEILNTVIEKAMDFISPEKHPLVKRIKDMSAAAVLVASITALITGGIIIIPKIL